MKKPHNILKYDIEKWLEDETPVNPADVDATEEALIQYAKKYAVEPSPDLRNRILGKLNTLSVQKRNAEKFTEGRWPFLDATSNWLEWKDAIAHIEPPEHYDGIYLHRLESTPHRDLFVVWVKEFVEEEVHHDLMESFMLLEGTCECHITDLHGLTRIVRMTAGDYIRMELGETHDVVITSLQPAKAILQWEKLRA